MHEPQSLLSLKAQLQERRKPLYQKIVRWMWIGVYSGITAIAVLFLTINFTGIPSFRELEDPQSSLASEVLANNGELLGRYFLQNRVPVAFSELSPWLEKALVSTEDERYYEHCGIDVRAIGRVVVRTVLLSDESAGGGSTITQQLAKMLYSDRDFKGMSSVERVFALIHRKLREWITAVKLERSYTKQEIIAMYLNQVDYVNNAYGIRAASEIYFGTTPNKLKAEEAATLVGMLQNPSRYNPVSRPERCIRRRMVVLSQMRYANVLTKPQYDSLKLLPLDMSRFRRLTFKEDKAAYMCAELKKVIPEILSRPECLKPDGSRYNIYKDGLKIYTTIDPAYQRHAEAAMREHMKTQQSRFFAVWRGRDPWSYKTDDKTTDAEIAQRRESLQNLVRSGDRYQSLRPKFLQAVTDKIQAETGFDPEDEDILNLLAEEKKKGSYSKLLAKGLISLDQATAYRKILDSKHWPELKKQWAALQTGIQKVYNTRVRMKVFSWAKPELERDTMMSPMDSLKYHRMFLQTGILAVDPTTAEVKAWVGGINYKYFQFDHINSNRQVGSTFKPFIYSTAMAQQNLTPCFQVYDMPVTIPAGYQSFVHGQDWTPRNATGTYSYRLMTLKEGLKNSVNSVSAYLMKQMGSTEPVFDMLNNMGVNVKKLPNSPTVCLGSGDMTVWEMTGAYTTFANNGVYAQPYVIKEIRNKNGKVIYRSLPEEHLALPAQANYLMSEMLQYNVKGAPGIGQLKSQVGGKTGTTNDFSDGWFMGVTPKLVVGTWVGGEDRWIRFTSLADGQGARMARPIFANFVKKLETDKSTGYDATARFKIPSGTQTIACETIVDQAPPAGGGEETGFDGESYGDESAPAAPAAGGRPGSPTPKPTTPPADKPKKPAQFEEQR
jgi:penicillin-binding protein 1A